MDGMNDPRLAPILRAATDEERERAIEAVIVGTIQPLARRILARYTASEVALDAEDILSTVDLQAMVRLRAVIASAEDAIEALEQYAATLVYNVIHTFLRRRFPEHTRLKNRLRYTVTHDRRFALWMMPPGPTCGLAAWKTSEPTEVGSLAATPAMLDRKRTGDAVAAVFRAAGRAMLLDTLVRVVAELWHVVDAPLRTVASARSTAADAAEQLESRDFLRKLWAEIRELRPLQRKALLLNLRDGEQTNVIQLLVATNTATLDDLAASMELTADELAALWDELPLDDLAIAARIGLTRQQVINLRKSARERLARRVLR